MTGLRVMPSLFGFLAALLVLASPASGRAAAAAERPPSQLRISVSGPEQVIYDDRQSHCGLREFPDSPPRAARQANGDLLLFATFETNWFMRGRSWDGLAPACASAGRASQNPDPRALDDKYWIQALHSRDGINFLALGSHEYLGGRHPGHCSVSSTTMAPPCWFSSITQYVSKGDAAHFVPAAGAHAVATPQTPFDPNSVKRVGYFTASNIVSDGQYLYVLVFAEGSTDQERGNCLFRLRLAPEPTAWRAWDGHDFTVDLSAVARPDRGAAAPARCRPVAGLPQEARGLVRHASSGTFIAVYSGRIGDRTGVVASVSRDLTVWSDARLILDAPLTRRDPDCAAVYRYPSIIDHTAPGFSFETVGDTPFLYGVKILLERCKPVARQITRIPLRVGEAGR